MTQAQLGAAIRRNQRQIERLENREDGEASYYTAHIAAVCGVDPWWLATGEGAMVRPESVPPEALALGSAWSYIKGGAKDSLAHHVLSTALSFMPTGHPLFKAAEKLYRESAKRQGIKTQLQGS